MKKDEVAERGDVAKAQAPVAKVEKKKDGRKEDAYEMAVSYTKEGDFAGWYSDVSLVSWWKQIDQEIGGDD